MGFHGPPLGFANIPQMNYHQQSTPHPTDYSSYEQPPPYMNQQGTGSMPPQQFNQNFNPQQRYHPNQSYQQPNVHQQSNYVPQPQQNMTSQYNVSSQHHVDSHHQSKKGRHHSQPNHEVKSGQYAPPRHGGPQPPALDPNVHVPPGCMVTYYKSQTQEIPPYTPLDPLFMASIKSM